jgi:ATP-binding cassette, subfamily B, bacterial
MEDLDQKKIRVPVRKIFSWYWRVVGKYRWYFLGSFVFYGLGVLFTNVLPPIVYKNLIDIIAKGIGSVESGDVWMWLWVLAGLRFTDFVMFRLADLTLFFSQSRAIRDIAAFTFGMIQRHSHGFFSDRFSGSLVSQTRRFVEAFPSLQDTVIFSVWLNVVMLLGMLTSLLFFSPALAAYFLVGIVCIVLVVLPLLGKRRKYNEIEAVEDSKVTGRFSDVITNILNVKMFSAGARESSSFLEFLNRQKHARDRAWWAFIALSATQNGLLGIVQVLGLVLSVRLWYQGEITPGTVVLMQTYLLSVSHIVWDLTHSLSNILRSFANASEMIEIFECPVDVLDPTDPEPFRMKKGAVEFRDVTFTYDGGDAVFKGFSFSVGAGEKVGLVGPSGGGKSTVTKLLLRFIDPQGGSVEVDGQDIRSIRQDDLRSKIAYVPQEPLLFHRSLFENISYGRPDATEEEVYDAAKRAHAHEFIEGLEKGYETLVGERGIKLSGGQRQRIAIARAILKDAPILVLDEATSALDSESEHAIQEALTELMEGRTAIVIAHRLSTIRKLDRIVVLDENGKIAEEGTHDGLVAKGVALCETLESPDRGVY